MRGKDSVGEARWGNITRQLHNLIWPHWPKGSRSLIPTGRPISINNVKNYLTGRKQYLDIVNAIYICHKQFAECHKDQ